MQEQEPQILITLNGPYEVSGNIPLYRQTMVPDANGNPTEWSGPDPLETEDTYWLCRCGHSKNKPFCDSSHRKVGFDGTETAGNQPYTELAETYHGPDLSYSDVRVLCSSGRFCNRSGGIRKLVEQPFGPEAAEIARQETFDCPSGRLVAVDHNSGQPVEPLFEKSISATEDPGRGVSGPLWIKGGIRIVSENGTEWEIRNRVALCRCGASRNKPFCDGSHIRVRFNASDSGAEV